MTDRDRLRALLVERSVRLGDFTLASGAHSDYYIDARTTTMCAEGQMLVGLVGYRAVVDAGLEPTHVGGLTMGADPVSYAIAHRSFIEGNPIDGFSVRKRAKEHGTGQRIEGGLPQKSRCLIIEDTITTGRSSMEAVAALRAHGSDILGVLCLVDRSEGRAQRFYDGQALRLISVFTGAELMEAAKDAQG